MKKLLIFAVMAAMGLSAQAQLMRSTTFYEKERVLATWYLRAGMSINNVAGANEFTDNGEGRSIGSKLGYDIAIGFQKSIKDKGFYWGMEFGLGTRGAKNERSSETYSLKRSFVAHDIKLTPLMFGYKYAFSDVLSLDVHLGAFGGFAYAGKGKEDQKWSSTSEEEKDSNEYGIDHALDTRFDAGIQAGVGVWLSRFNVDLTYQRGFMSINPVMFGYEYGKSSNLILRVGVSF